VTGRIFQALPTQIDTQTDTVALIYKIATNRSWKGDVIAYNAKNEK
jgi:hypothetical protein